MSNTWCTCIVLPQFYVPTCVVQNNSTETGLGHHGFHMSLVGGVIGAKTNSHDLLARSSTCYWNCWQSKNWQHRRSFNLLEFSCNFISYNRSFVQCNCKAACLQRFIKRGHITRPHPSRYDTVIAKDDSVEQWSIGTRVHQWNSDCQHLRYQHVRTYTFFSYQSYTSHLND